MTEQDFVFVDVDNLETHPANPRRGDLNAITDSIRSHGFYGTIVVQASTMRVLAGNHRLMAARRLGIDQVPVALIDVDDDEAKRILLADNRANDRAGYDDDGLLELLAELDATERGLEGTLYCSDDLDALLGNFDSKPGQQPADPDRIPEPPADPVTNPGDVWLLGPHRVMCGDARNAGHVERLLDGARPAVAFTSPPYASQRKYDEASEFRPIHPDAYVEWFADVAANVRATLADDGSWLLNIKEHCDDGQRHLYVKDLTIAHVRRWGWRFVDELCWVDTKNGVPGGWPNRFKDAWEPVFHYSATPKIKFNALANGTETHAAFVSSPHTQTTGTGSGLLGRKGSPEVEGIARPSNVVHIAASSESDHSAAFPVALPSWFIRAYSDPGDPVFDPFAGSGTTLIAAHAEQRIGYGMEISPRYCDVICKRWQEQTGIEPVLADSGGK